MTNANPKVIARLNAAAEKRLRTQAEIDARTATFKTEKARLKSAYKADIQPLQERAHRLDQRIWQLIDDNHATLFEPGKQSFETVAAKFKLCHWTSKQKVLNEAGILEAARQLRVIRKIADAPRIWTLNRDKFTAWLSENGDYRHLFEDYLTDEEPRESLALEENSTDAVFHSTKRISQPPVIIPKS